MKQLAAYSQQLGERGSAQGSVGVEGSDLVAKVQVEYRHPIDDLVQRVQGPANQLIDQIEKWIPGDQKEEAEKLKASFRAAVVKAISEPAELPAPEQA